MEKNKRTAEEAEAAKNLADIPVKRVNRELKYQGSHSEGIPGHGSG